MSGRKKKGSVRDRVPGIQKKDQETAAPAEQEVKTVVQDQKEEAQVVNQAAPGNETEAPKAKRIPATEADYLAAQLHEAQGKIVDLRGEILALRNQMLQKDQVILQREQTILALETREVERNKQKLREDHGLVMGRTMEKDDKTGEVFWLEAEAPQK